MSDESITTLAAAVRRAETRAVARALRFIDDRDPKRLPLLAELHPATGRAYVIGVTGTPGAGKSTLVDQLIQRFREGGQTVAVVAVDPSSPFSGGAILGDRIRMQRHFLDEGVFIRSAATRGHLGGLSRSATDMTRVLDAAGYDIVLVETVGVGQDELDIIRLAHTTIVITAPGLGDDIQAIKAGILEIADVFAVNKADRDGADATVRDLEQMIMLGQVTAGPKATGGHSAAGAMKKPDREQPDRWVPPVIKTVATRGEGLPVLLAACRAHQTFLATTDTGRAVVERRRRDEFRRIVREELIDAAESRISWEAVEATVISGQHDPYTAAIAVVQDVLNTR